MKRKQSLYAMFGGFGSLVIIYIVATNSGHNQVRTLQDIADQDQNQGNETTDTNGDSLSTVQTSTVAPSPRMVQHTSETEIDNSDQDQTHGNETKDDARDTLTSAVSSPAQTSAVTPTHVMMQPTSETEKENISQLTNQDQTDAQKVILLKLGQLRRIQRIRAACSNSSLFANRIYRRNNMLKYLFSPKYNFNTCKVPQVGSTFWTQAMAVLKNGVGVAKAVFNMSRRSVHQKLTAPNLVIFDSDEMRKSRSILVSRNPYARLYSSYVDHILLPDDPTRTGPGKTIRNNLYFTETAICYTDITFQEFLREILTAVYAKKTLNRRWAPISSLCDPCKVSTFALVKEESFSTDVEFALQKIGIATDEFDVIHDALGDQRIETTVPGIVYTVLKTKSNIKPCKTQMEIAKGIWLSFQIQGFIRANIPFPSELIDSEGIVEPEFLTDLIIKTSKAYPLTQEESKEQWHRFLANAYKNIDKKTVEGIQKVYRQDFVIFDYSLEPPSIRNVYN